jgi:hypothetical protein
MCADSVMQEAHAMNRHRFFQLALAIGLSLVCVECSFAYYFFPPGYFRPRLRRRDPASWKASVPPPPSLVGLPVPRYGDAPDIVPNPYPWHTSNMFSAFRHYHVAPPLVLDGLEVPPAENLEPAPMPKTLP